MTSIPTLQPAVCDPGNVPETLCDGMFGLCGSGSFVTLTFTHQRPQAGPMFEGRIEQEFVVRARIVMTAANLVALRDFLAARIDTAGQQAETGVSAGVH